MLGNFVDIILKRFNVFLFFFSSAIWLPYRYFSLTYLEQPHLPDENHSVTNEFGSANLNASPVAGTSNLQSILELQVLSHWANLVQF